MTGPFALLEYRLSQPPGFDDLGDMIAQEVTYRRTRGADHIPDDSPRIDVTEMFQRLLDSLSGTVEDDDDRVVIEANELTFDIVDGRIVVYAQDVTVESYDE